MRKPIIRAVVFDMDGLMFDTERLYYQVGHQLLQRRGKEMSPELAGAMMGRRPTEALEILRGWHGLSDPIELLADESRKLYLQMAESELRPMPGLIALLEVLEKAQVPCAVATSSPRMYAAQALRQSHLTDQFRFVLAAEDVTKGKPHPEIYLTAARVFGIPAAHMLVLEDSQAGLQAAKAAGAICAVVTHDYNTHQDLSQADAVLPALDAPELLQWLSTS